MTSTHYILHIIFFAMDNLAFPWLQLEPDEDTQNLLTTVKSCKYSPELFCNFLNIGRF